MKGICDEMEGSGGTFPSHHGTESMDMEKELERIGAEMEKKLTRAESEEEAWVTRISKCLGICSDTVGELRQILHGHHFESIAAEIRFFKIIFPEICQYLFYYGGLLKLETRKPLESERKQIKFFRSCLKDIQRFAMLHSELNQYLQSGVTYLDEIYFSRSSSLHHHPGEQWTVLLDTTICTVHSCRSAKLLADARLADYINRQLASKQKKGQRSDMPDSRTTPLRWTSPKIALIELIYALQEGGVFNNATADIKFLTGYFETAFQVELGNVYNAFQEMRLRKKNRSQFLDQLKERLLARMDEMDER